MAVIVIVTGACSGPPSVTNPPKESTVPNSLTQKQVTDGVERYGQLVGTQLPPGSKLAIMEQGTGTVECFTPDGKDLSGQIFFRKNWLVDGIDPANYQSFADLLRDTWRGLGYRIIDDVHYQDLDRTVRFATHGDDYHLTVYTYGDNRSIPLVVVESPCAWPEPKPSSTSRPS